MKKNVNTLSAVIDIGSSAIRMLIAELSESGWRRLDSLEKKTELGFDVFENNEISRNGMLECLEILTQFKEILKTWEIPVEEVQVIGTSALREAFNKDVFIDRVFLRTGFKVRVIEGVEANQLTYAAVHEAMRKSWSKFNQSNSLVVEVSGGSTEVMLLHRGKIVTSHTYRTGTIRIQQQLNNVPGSVAIMSDLISENMVNILDNFDHEYPLKQIRHFVALGGELRFIASKIGKRIGEIWQISVKQFDAFFEELSRLSTTEIASKYRIPMSEAATLIPLFSVYSSLLERTASKFVLVPDVSIRDGAILTLGNKGKTSKRKFRLQVIASAKSLGRKFHFDESHASHVAKHSKKIFDAIKKEYALDDNLRLLLEISALLHDIGSFINQSAHHKHSFYVVRNSELFGLNRDDIEIISHVVRYHRKALPGAGSSHSEFNSLDRNVRMAIMKLAAILRVADALDSGHAQKLEIQTVTTDDQVLKIITESSISHSLESISLKYKCDLFEEIYGMNIILTAGGNIF
ncbi:MAG: HD domain-containing protein [Lentisphaeraceae bacterium]|nr:HD domain-containing protein [Lentisphaeraceae bacterium]